MTRRKRTLLIFIFFLALLALLATGLNGLELKEGIKFDFKQINGPEIISGTVVNLGFWPLIIKAILVLATLLAPAYFIYMLIDKNRRKRLLIDLIIFSIVFLLLNQLRQTLTNKMVVEDINIQFSGDIPTLEAAAPGVPVPTPPVPSDLAVTVTAVVVGVGAVLLLGLFWLMIARARRPQPTVMVQLATQAEETIEALITGQDLRSTILLCYRRMTEIAAKSRNLPREVSVTPHEFENILIANGLPTNPVHDLTRLFEDVRYGDQVVGEEERKRAVNALRVVAAVCRPVEQAQ